MIDKFNFGALAIGAPGSGKTTVVRRWLVEFLTRYPTGVAIVHDTQGQFGDLCATYRSTDEYRETARKAAAARTTIQRGVAIIDADSQAVGELALGLAEQHNLGQPHLRLPIFLAWDETSMLGETGSTHVGRLDWRITSTRRHLGIATAHNLQRPGSLPVAMYETATEVAIFRLTSEDSARTLETKLGLGRGALQSMLTADKFRYALWRAGEGLVA